MRNLKERVTKETFQEKVARHAYFSWAKRTNHGKWEGWIATDNWFRAKSMLWDQMHREPSHNEINRRAQEIHDNEVLREWLEAERTMLCFFEIVS